MKAYKVFDENWCCKGFQYEVERTYSISESPIICIRGFHACKKVSDCFFYYSFDPKNKVAEVELFGTILGEDEDKQCADNITILKEISWSEMLVLANSGTGNSGYRNSGYRNSGYSNSGYSNSGDSNSGYSNSGDINSGDSYSGDSNSGKSNSGNFNSCNYETGMFNSKQSNNIRVFNNSCKRIIWENAIKPNFIYFDLNIWIYFSDMTDEEKIDNPKAFICNGYLKTRTYKEAWWESYLTATKEDLELLKALPNFDAKIFEEITGIKID